MHTRRHATYPLRLVGLFFLMGTAGCSPSGDGASAETEQDVSSSVPRAADFLDLEFDARFPVGFSFLNGVRELSDGSVLAADPLSQVVLRIDPELARADTLGRQGPGPQEYQQPDQVLPLPGDTSLLVDLGKAQLTTILPDGTFGSGISMVLPSDEGLGEILHPQFVDGQGHLYDLAGRRRGNGPPDSAAVVRYHRDSATLDTVGAIWMPEMNARRTRGRGFLPKLMEERDDWAVGSDGALAIIRAHGHIVEWTDPTEGKAVGPGHGFQTEPVERRDKEALLQSFRSEGISMTAVANRSGSVSRMSMSRGLPGGGDGPSVEEYEWAENFPVFRPDRAVVAPSGVLWLERWLPVGSPSQWELFDREGRWLGSVTLPPRYRLLTFGHTADGHEAVYVVSTDEFDLRWLERYRVVR